MAWNLASPQRAFWDFEGTEGFLSGTSFSGSLRTASGLLLWWRGAQTIFRKAAPW